METTYIEQSIDDICLEVMQDSMQRRACRWAVLNSRFYLSEQDQIEKKLLERDFGSRDVELNYNVWDEFNDLYI